MLKCPVSDAHNKFVTKLMQINEFFVDSSINILNRAVVDSDTPYEAGNTHIGKMCRIIRETSHDTYDYDEVGKMYDIEFEDGTALTANPEELFKNGICITPKTMFLNGKVLWNPDVFTEEEKKNAQESFDKIAKNAYSMKVNKIPFNLNIIRYDKYVAPLTLEAANLDEAISCGQNRADHIEDDVYKYESSFHIVVPNTKLVTKPMTRTERRLMTQDGILQFMFSIDLQELIENDIEHLIDLILDLAGTVEYSDLSYTIAGFKEDTVFMYVSGIIEDTESTCIHLEHDGHCSYIMNECDNTKGRPCKFKETEDIGNDLY